MMLSDSFMKPLTKLNETRMPDGTALELWERDDAYLLLQDGLQIGSSFSHGSDDILGEIGVSPIRKANQPTILIAGLNLGFVLDSAITHLTREKASFVVAEPTAELVEWHQEHLKGIHQNDIWNDDRVSIEYLTALGVARKSPKKFHAILMKSTAGRPPMSVAEASDYAAALRGGGLLVISLGRSDRRLERTLQKAGFQVNFESVPAAHKGKQNSFHTIIIAKKGHYVSQSSRSR